MSATRLRSPPKHAPRRLRNTGDLRALQRLMGAAIFRPLTRSDGMKPRWIDGRPMTRVAAEFMKANDRLSAFERLEIYNRIYWFRLLDSIHDDYPGLRAFLGARRFWRLVQAYLAKHPSRSYTLRNLGSRLARFIAAEPSWTAPRTAAAVDLARFEWAQIVAFDGAARPPLPAAALRGPDPARLRLALQPHLTLLACRHATDDYVLAVKRRDHALRAAASNAVSRKAAAEPAARPPRLQPERVHLAVHRFDNQIYYKRLSLPEYRLLRAVAAGRTLSDACAAAFRGSRSVPVEQAASIRSWFTLWRRLGWICARE
jgi:hypothetical protein